MEKIEKQNNQDEHKEVEAGMTSMEQVEEMPSATRESKSSKLVDTLRNERLRKHLLNMTVWCVFTA